MRLGTAISAACRGLIVALTLGSAVSAQAADPVSPPGSRIGLVPPPGFNLATSFAGFENRMANASIVFMEMPTQDFRKVIQGMTAEALAKQGLKLDSTEKIDGSPFDAVILRGEKPLGGLLIDVWMMVFDAKSFVGMIAVNVERRLSPVVRDSEIRSALASVQVSAQPVSDPFLALPFAVRPPKRFKYQKALVGRTMLLRDNELPPVGKPDDVGMTIGLASDAQVGATDQKSFGEQLLKSMKAQTLQQIISTRPVTTAGLRGFEYIADGKLSTANLPVRIILVVLFSDGHPYFLMGLAPPSDFDAALPDFHAVIDSFQLKP